MMKIRITSVTAPSVGKSINDVTTTLEDFLSPAFQGKQYGGNIEQLTVFYVSVESEPSENFQYCQKHNRSGKYKDVLSGKMVSYIGLAVPINPDQVIDEGPPLLRALLIQGLFTELEHPPYQFPRNFDRQRFLDDLRLALDTS